MSECPLCQQQILTKILSGKTIALDVGHGWNESALYDVGAEGNGTTEQELNSRTAKRTAEFLEMLGAKVHVFDYSSIHSPRLNLNAKGKRAGAINADVFVSIHHNAFNGQAQGTETCIHSQATPEDEILAKHIQDQLVEHLKLHDRGIKKQQLGVLKGCPESIPCCLTEGFFIDAARFKGSIPPEVTEQYALGIAIGIKNFFASKKSS
jgi:N-acetylmuramoyl-L-alanine amidase